MRNTKIDWAESSWNPVTGCLHGCEYCYARSMAHRYAGFNPESTRGNGEWNTIQYEKDAPRLAILNGRQYRTMQDGKKIVAPYPFDFAPTLHRYRLDIPARWKKPRSIFVCSMADLFGDWVPDEWIAEVFDACKAAPWHRFLFLSKNPQRVGELYEAGKLLNGENVWFGTSITDANSTYAFKCGNRNTFVSIEPLLGPIVSEWQIAEVDWAIIGAETGCRKGKVLPERAWIDEILEICERHHTPVFMKSSIRNLMGDDFWQEYPWEAT